MTHIIRITREQYINKHFITLKLRQLGVSNEQLNAMRFRSANIGQPFSLWSCSWQDGTPVTAVYLIKSYCALKWLVLNKPEPSEDRAAAERLISETMAAPNFLQGIEFIESQRARASKERILITIDKKSIATVIKEFSEKPDHKDATAKELWPHFFSELQSTGLEPLEINGSDLKKSAYEYDFKDKTRKMTFGRFCNIISKFRSEKKKSR